MVATEGVGGGNALYGGVEFFEQFFSDAGGDLSTVAPTQHVFVSDDYAVRLSNGCGNGLPVVRRKRAQVDDFDVDALTLQLCCGHFGAMNEGAVGDDAEVRALFHHSSLAERNHKVRPRILRAVVGLAVKMLMLEEHDRVVAADRRAQKARDVERAGRHHHAKTRAMGENRFAALAVIHAPAGEVAADGYTQHHRRFERPIRTPAHHTQLIANLHHGRPNVVEELDFRDRLQAAGGHADRAAHDARLSERRIENAVVAVLAL